MASESTDIQIRSIPGFRPLLPFTLVVFLSLTSCDLFRPEQTDPGPPPLFSALSTELSATTITAYPTAPLAAGENQVWCATFALAWNTMIDSIIGEPIQLSGPDSTQATVTALNQRIFDAAYLDPASYVALAGFRDEGICTRIQDALLATFGDDAPVVAFEPGLPAEVISFAYLLKRLDFEHVFTTIERALRFNGDPDQKVRAFGLESDERGGRANAMREQVIVKGAIGDGYIIEIETLAESDHLVLAAIEPEASLLATWQTVVAIDAAHTDYLLPSGMGLKVPKMNFALEHEFAELIDWSLLNEGWVDDDYYIKEARQDIRFQLTERGAVLESSAGMTTAPLSSGDIVFDRPFLLALIEEGAAQPYFLLWIANAELLARVP